MVDGERTSTNGTNTRRGTMTTTGSQILQLVTLLLRIALWPVNRFFSLLFPPRELDGLTPAVTAKAAQQFSAYLRTLIPTLQEQVFTTAHGFTALKQEAIDQHKLLVVYLHSPLHRRADQVVRDLICHESILNVLEPMALAIGVSIHTAQGAQLAQLLGAASFPLFCVLAPSTSTIQLLFKVEGPVFVNMTVYQLQGYLTAVWRARQGQLAQQESRRIQIQQDNDLRREQEAEYAAALAADRERARQQREEEARVREEVEAAQRDVENAQREKEARLQQAKDMLREEPSSGETNIRFTLSSGRKVQRRFYSDEKVGALRAYLTMYMEEQGMDEMPNIGLSTAYPKRTYNSSDDNLLSLSEAGLSPQAVLMVQDLDA